MMVLLSKGGCGAVVVWANKNICNENTELHNSKRIEFGQFVVDCVIVLVSCKEVMVPRTNTNKQN